MQEELFIANHAAATVDGTKASSLICLKTLGRKMISEETLEALESDGVKGMYITNRLSCPLILLYREDLLQAVLDEPVAREILGAAGYGEFTVGAALEKLRERFSCALCPDEIGVFLGYPLMDVKSYIEKGGKDPLYSGYWKVYHDLDKAKALEECFMCSRERMTKMINSGMSLREVLAA